MESESTRPAAIIKRRPIRLKGAAMSELRHQAMERDEGRCVDCGTMYGLELSHDIPRSLGGADTLDNVHMRCRECHRQKDLHGQPGHF